MTLSVVKDSVKQSSRQPGRYDTAVDLDSYGNISLCGICTREHIPCRVTLEEETTEGREERGTEYAPTTIEE